MRLSRQKKKVISALVNVEAKNPPVRLLRILGGESIPGVGSVCLGRQAGK